MRYGSLYDLLHNETLEIDGSMVVDMYSLTYLL